MAEAGRLVLMYFVLPLWIFVGLADWFCHRVTHIERTSGPTESLFHLLSLAEIGTAVLCAMFLEINALVLLIMLAVFVVHALTAWADVHFTSDKREITPTEQSVHNYLEALPLLGLGIIVVMHFDQFQALFGFSDLRPDFSIRVKSQPLPAGYIVAALVGSLTLNVIPLVEELIRGLRAQR